MILGDIIQANILRNEGMKLFLRTIKDACITHLMPEKEKIQIFETAKQKAEQILKNNSLIFPYVVELVSFPLFDRSKKKMTIDYYFTSIATYDKETYDKISNHYGTIVIRVNKNCLNKGSNLILFCILHEYAHGIYELFEPYVVLSDNGLRTKDITLNTIDYIYCNSPYFEKRSKDDLENKKETFCHTIAHYLIDGNIQLSKQKVDQNKLNQACEEMLQSYKEAIK